MLLYAPSVDRRGLAGEPGVQRIRKFPFTDGGVDMIERKAARESFGGIELMSDAPLYFTTEKVHQPDGLFDGTVGSALFSGRRVTFDFQANRFWIT
jgi:hypothetical protein